MDNQNITVSLKKDVLRKAKILAIQRQTSLSTLLSQTIEDLVARDESYNIAWREHLTLLGRGFDFETGGKLPGQREDLHER
jgi:hypothetical protein